MTLKLDPRAITERRREADELEAGRCPHSGLSMTVERCDGWGLPDRLICGVCDCFGFPVVET